MQKIEAGICYTASGSRPVDLFSCVSMVHVWILTCHLRRVLSIYRCHFDGQIFKMNTMHHHVENCKFLFEPSLCYRKRIEHKIQLCHSHLILLYHKISFSTFFLPFLFMYRREQALTISWRTLQTEHNHLLLS